MDLPSFLKKDSVTKLVPIVSSARAVRIICEKWKNNYDYLPDAVVLEGPKAGGHLGYKENQLEDEHFSLEELLPQVVEEVSHFEEKYNKRIPVIAAGGIYTGEDIKRVMDLGASGVQLGTRFVTTTECDASDAFKESYVKAQEKDIEIIKSPVGMPGRAIHSHFLEKVKAGMKQPKVCPFNCIKTCDISRSPLLYRNSPVQCLQRELRERLRFRRKQCLADNPHHVGERNDKRADQRVETL